MLSLCLFVLVFFLSNSLCVYVLCVAALLIAFYNSFCVRYTPHGSDNDGSGKGSYSGSGWLR